MSDEQKSVVRQAVAARRSQFMQELARQESDRLAEEWLERLEEACTQPQTPCKEGDYKALMEFMADLNKRIEELVQAQKNKSTDPELVARIEWLETENTRLHELNLSQ